MPKVERIIDPLGIIRPLITTQYKGDKNRDSRISIQSEEGLESLTIFFENDNGNSKMDTLEIGGIPGTVEQWRKILLPILRIPYNG